MFGFMKMFGIWKGSKADKLPTKSEVLKALKRQGYYERDGLKFGEVNDETTDGYLFCNMCCEEIGRCECRDSEAIIALIRRR